MITEDSRDRFVNEEKIRTQSTGIHVQLIVHCLGLDRQCLLEIILINTRLHLSHRAIVVLRGDRLVGRLLPQSVDQFNGLLIDIVDLLRGIDRLMNIALTIEIDLWMKRESLEGIEKEGHSPMEWSVYDRYSIEH